MPAAPRFEVIDLIGPEKVSAEELGPTAVTISVSFLVVSTGVAEQTNERDERDQRGEEREQAVVRERGSPVGHAVLAELEHGALERREEGRARVRAGRAEVHPRALRRVAGGLGAGGRVGAAVAVVVAVGDVVGTGVVVVGAMPMGKSQLGHAHGLPDLHERIPSPPSWRRRTHR